MPSVYLGIDRTVTRRVFSREPPGLRDVMSNPVNVLQTDCAAVRLSFTWMGLRRTLSAAQKDEAAAPFRADGKSLSVSKKLLDTKHPLWKAISAIRNQARSYWKGSTLPFPEDGIRLIRRGFVHEFEKTMDDMRRELRKAIDALESEYHTLRSQAREQLGTLFNADDYPDTLRGQFSIEWDFPSVEVPSYLAELSPAIYEREQARVKAQFDQSVSLAETAFAEEFSKLISHLADRLTPGEAGEQKRLNGSALGNLTEFFDRFSKLSLRSSPELDNLVEQAKGLVSGVETKELRTDEGLRTSIRQQMAAIDEAIQVEVMPTRRIRSRVAPPVAAPVMSEPAPSTPSSVAVQVSAPISAVSAVVGGLFSC